MSNEDKPIVVNPSPVADQTATATRDLLLVLAALPALIAVFGTRDVGKIVSYIGSSEFAPVLGLLVGAAVIGWRQFISRRKKTELVTVAEAAPNSVAVVKGTPAADRLLCAPLAVAAALVLVLLSGCNLLAPTTAGGSTPVAAVKVELASTTALSLAELATNSATATATAALKTGHLSLNDANLVAAYVHDMRYYREQARLLIQTGGNASAMLAALNATIINLKAITG